MDDRFYNAFLGCRVKVCGTLLRDLTPWHILLLHAVESPMVADMNGAGRREVLQFLRIVDCSYPDIPDMRPRLRDVFQFIRLSRKKTLKREILKLRHWLKVQSCTPQLYQQIGGNSSSRHISSPSMLALVAKLVLKARMTVSEAWNTRLAEARWMDIAVAELEGATINISYENETAAETNYTDEEAIELAKKTLPPAIYKKWIAARKKNPNAHI